MQHAEHGVGKLFNTVDDNRSLWQQVVNGRGVDTDAVKLNPLLMDGIDSDPSHAFFRRVSLITFNQRIDKSQRDIHLSDKLQKELPGILNLCLGALGELLQRGELTEPYSSIEARKQWAKEAEPLEDFMEECLIFCSDERTSSSEIFQCLNQWKEQNGITSSISMKKMVQRLKNRGCASNSDGTQRYIAGVMLR